MKYLVLLLVVLGVLWFVRATRKRGSTPPPQKPADTAPSGSQPTAALQEPMVACAQCGVHMPQGEAVPGQGDFFCGDKHRIEFEKQHLKP